jgi:hypothetical protein
VIVRYSRLEDVFAPRSEKGALASLCSSFFIFSTEGFYRKRYRIHSVEEIGTNGSKHPK